MFVVIFLALAIPTPPVHAVALNDAIADSAKDAISGSVVDTISDYWSSLWLRSDQRGYQALRYGQPEKAVTLFDDHPQWQSVAQYRSGDYTGSLRGFRGDATVTGRYNEANTLARLGEYEAALANYDQVLAVQPEHEDALFNKDLVERLLQQQQDDEQQNQDQQSEGNNQDSESEQDNQQQEQDQSEQDQQSDDAEQREQEQSEEQQEQEQQGEEQKQAQAEQDETSRDEKQDALEQWLRRVPDDPGGLLRRKFSHETKQRLRRGERPSRQGDKVW